MNLTKTRLANLEIREASKTKNVYFWEIADKLGVADATFRRWMRKEFEQEMKLKVLSIIDQIATEHEEP